MGRSSIDNPSPSDYESVTDHRLPQDLINEILVYLPVKSLVRFKCVSKPWLNLISSPPFIKSHFSTSSRKGQHFNHQLLFVARYPDSGMKHCSLSDALHNPSPIVSDIEYPFPSSVHIVGIVNGLVCLSVDPHGFYICNPVLKQFKRLPSYTVSPLEFCVVRGFGYDQSNDDYKVVKLANHPSAMVYSLRSDSWKIIEGFEGVCMHGGTYVNGKILWISLRSSSKALGYTKWEIVSLDMASDKFEKMQLPCYDYRNSCPCGIDLFRGSLCMLFTENKRAELWVIDENGVENSWSKVFSLAYDDCVCGPRPKFYTLRKVVCILGDGEIVLEDTLGLNVYCTKTKDFRKIQLDGLYRDFFVYVESLVAL